MDGPRPAAGPAARIDAPMLWLALRTAEILFAVICAKMVYLTLDTQAFLESAISFGGMFLMVALFVHRVVTGFADGAGIRYRRYFLWKRLAWSEVQEIQWKGARLRVLVRGKKKPRAVLEFLLNPVKAKASYWGHRLGADIEPPDVLRRIRAFQTDAPPAMNSAPPVSRWVFRLFLVFGGFFLLVMVWRLLSAAR